MALVAPSSDRPRHVDTLGLTGVGVGLVSLGASLLPVTLPRLLPIAGCVIGAGCVLLAGLQFLRSATDTRRTAGGRVGVDRDRMLALATDCARVRDGIAELVTSAPPKRRSLALRSRAVTDALCERQLIARYSAEFRQLALDTLDEADAWCTVSDATRRLAQGQSAAHIRLLPSVFVDLEQQLRRFARSRE